MFAADQAVDADDLACRTGARDPGERALRAAFDGVRENHHHVTLERTGRLGVEVVDQLEIEVDQQRKDLRQGLRTGAGSHLALAFVQNRMLFDEARGPFEGGCGGETGSGGSTELQFDGGQRPVRQPAHRRELHVELQIVEQRE